eukprot:3897750-Rhodomonas_salina.1
MQVSSLVFVSLSSSPLIPCLPASLHRALDLALPHPVFLHALFYVPFTSVAAFSLIPQLCTLSLQN